jgi:hypothetical protein
MVDGYLGAHIIDYTSLVISMKHSRLVLEHCERQLRQIKNPIKKAVAIELLRYLRNRREESHMFSFDDAQIISRSDFIQNFINALARNDESEKRLLTEDKIIGFKGFFSHNLYDLLAGYRDGYPKPFHNYLYCLTKLPQIKTLQKRTFAEELLAYFRIRLNSKSYFSKKLDLLQRSVYIRSFFEVLPTNNKFDENNLLKEESIVGFKGTLTQRLYDIVAKYRFMLGQKVEIEMETVKRHGTRPN